MVDVRRRVEVGVVAALIKPLDLRRLETTIVEAMEKEPVDGNGAESVGHS
jgi:hypothetical protein